MLGSCKGVYLCNSWRLPAALLHGPWCYPECQKAPNLYIKEPYVQQCGKKINLSQSDSLWFQLKPLSSNQSWAIFTQRCMLPHYLWVWTHEICSWMQVHSSTTLYRKIVSITFSASTCLLWFSQPNLVFLHGLYIVQFCLVLGSEPCWTHSWLLSMVPSKMLQITTLITLKPDFV